MLWAVFSPFQQILIIQIKQKAYKDKIYVRVVESKGRFPDMLRFHMVSMPQKS